MQDNPKVFLQHLLELKKRILIVAAVLIIAFIVFYKNVQTLMSLLFYPLKKSGSLVHEVIYTSLPEAFLSEINIGVFFVQMLILPRAVDFFIAFEANADLKFMPKLSEYVSFCERFMIVFGIGFELPIILWLMVSFNLISVSILKKRWRIVVLCICTVSAVITPPDALSMLALAVPLILLYVITIVVIHYFDKRKVIQKGEMYA